MRNDGGARGLATGGANNGGDPSSSQSGALRAAVVVDVTPNDFDKLILARLATLGIQGEPIAQAEADTESLSFANLVVVAPSADGVTLGALLSELKRPELILEPAVAAAQSLGKVLSLTNAKTRIDVVDPANPLAGGQRGVVEVCSTASLMTSNLAPAPAVVVAKANLNDNAAVLYAVLAGEEIDGSPLLADRVVFSVLHSDGCRTALALAFFDSSVEWLLRAAR